jgi:hypothetical protein
MKKNFLSLMLTLSLSGISSQASANFEEFMLEATQREAAFLAQKGDGSGELIDQGIADGAGDGAAEETIATFCIAGGEEVCAVGAVVIVLVVAIPVITCSAEDADHSVTIEDAKNGQGVCVKEFKS